MNPGQSMEDSGNLVFKGQRIAATGSGWVRVNFRLGPYASPNANGWFAAYDQIVDDYVSRGVKVFGLIGAESVHSSHPHGSDAWIGDYVANVVAIVGHFKDRVRVYESYNEPNNWAWGTSQPILSPERFAALLQRVYLETKFYNGHGDDPSWQVTLVSGPLFSHDNDEGASYIQSTYLAGRNQHAWDWVCAQLGTFPLDALGFHIYVEENPSASEAQVLAALRYNVDQFTGSADEQENACPTPGDKPVWITEVGFNAISTTEPIQARNVGPLFDAWRDDPRVPVFFWFTMDDFPGGAWGLFRLDGSARPAYAEFVNAIAEGDAQ